MPTYLIERVKKHFIYVHYGCGKQSKMDYSLNHGNMASFPLDSHPELLKTNHSGFGGVTVQGCTYMPRYPIERC